jgi:hypothetical protein
MHGNLVGGRAEDRVQKLPEYNIFIALDNDDVVLLKIDG